LKECTFNSLITGRVIAVFVAVFRGGAVAHLDSIAVVVTIGAWRCDKGIIVPTVSTVSTGLFGVFGVAGRLE